jgi:hypothetical protein
MRKTYGLLSFFALLGGITIYILFRNTNNLLIFEWIPILKIADIGAIRLKPSVFSYILRYNLPDMLWFLSGIMLLRCIWFHRREIQRIYVFCFYGMGLFFELSQLSMAMPGTFDPLDLLFMGIGAGFEGLIYCFFIRKKIQ